MITLSTLKNAVERELDSRHLKSRCRYTALNQVTSYIQTYYSGNLSCLDGDKDKFKQLFVERTGHTSGAASSVINTLYEQYTLFKVRKEDPIEQRISCVHETHIPKSIVHGTTIVHGNDKINCFPPLIDEDSEILILGTMPGLGSLKTGQYYTSAHNSFWKIISAIYNSGCAFVSYQEKVECLKKNHIALWDVFKSCQREGAADSSIKEQIPNDIEELLRQYPRVKLIVLNGQKAAAGFYASINYVSAPSTASYKTFAEKLVSWKKCLMVE